MPTQTVSFSALGVADDVAAALTARGIEEPFPIQQMAIPDALAGRDVCGKAKTGSGKTLAFGIPALERVGKAESKRPSGLVLVPTRELAVQVRDELAPLAELRDVRIAAVYGGSSMGSQIRRLERGVELVVATPGRLIDLIDRGAVEVGDVDVVVIDEADRMADMGFMPQVEWVLRHVNGSHQTLLFSATLDSLVNGLITRYQDNPVMHAVEGEEQPLSVQEMHHRFLIVHEMDKARVAAAIASGASRTLVFAGTRHGASRLVRDLRDLGVKAAAIHGDLRQKERERALGGFSKGRLPVLVATDVAARGIHVDDVEVVVHYDPPPDHKTYVHRSGRTARAGESGVVVTLVLWNEELEVRRLQRRLGIDEPFDEVFSNDPRLRDLNNW